MPLSLFVCTVRFLLLRWLMLLLLLWQRLPATAPTTTLLLSVLLLLPLPCLLLFLLFLFLQQVLSSPPTVLLVAFAPLHFASIAFLPLSISLLVLIFVLTFVPALLLPQIAHKHNYARDIVAFAIATQLLFAAATSARIVARAMLVDLLK